MTHLVLFDGECALCHRAVRTLLSVDRDRRFFFAPLQGATAKKFLPPPISLDSLILIENFEGTHPKIWRYGKGALRICWHLSGCYKLLGLLSFLPRWPIDPLYRLIARNRHLLIRATPSGSLEEMAEGRLLP